MKKETVVVSLVVVGGIAFLLGRMSVSTDRPTDPPASARPAPTPAAVPSAPLAAQPMVAAQPTAAQPTAAQPTAAQPTAAQPTAAQPGAVANPRRGAAAAVTRSPIKGPAEAKVTIMEISDFQCPFCGRVNPTIKQIRDTYKDDVRVVFKHNPLGFHQRALPAALASMAAHRQGKFWEMHDKLFGNQRALSDADLERYAKELGLDAAKFKADMADATLKDQILNEQKAAVALGQGGTPAFLINGQALSGAQPFAKFKAAIDPELAEANKLVAAGKSLAEVHKARVMANLGRKSTIYFESLQGDKPAPAPAAAAKPATRKPRPVDKTVWKALLQGHEPTWGKPDALITIVEISDFQCPFCTRVNPTLAKIKETWPNDVRIAFKHNALPFHKRALPAAVASMAAHRQGKFWEMHDKLFANQKALEDADLERYAQEIGLNVDQYKKDIADPALTELVKKDMAYATTLNARGTPNFFVNGRNVRGAVPFESFESVIVEELAKARKLVESGTPAADVYAALVGNGKTFEPLDSQVNDFDMSDAPFLGNKDGDLVITEFSDFQCPYCSRVGGPLKQLMKDPEIGSRVKIVFKHFPLSFHKEAEPAARAAIAAQRQGKFWEMHDKLFANQKSLSEAKFTEWAQEIGLDMAKFKADYAAPETAALVKKDMAEGTKSGVRGTPSVYLNGRKFQASGGYAPAAFKSVVNQYFKK